MSSSIELRRRVIALYKQLSYLGRDYPLGSDWFHAKLKGAFSKNRTVKDPAEINKLIARGEYVVKEIEALYSLRKYRELKKRYYSEDTLTPGDIQKFESSALGSATSSKV